LASSTTRPGCLGALFGFLFQSTQNTGSTENLPYRVRDDFLSSAELSFFGVLNVVLQGRAVVCAKVNLSDIFFVAHPNENQAAYNRISRKHVDFLVCDLTTVKPLFGIELDDASHTRADRQKRDEFVEAVFRTAALPLVRIPAQQAYNVATLAAEIATYLGGRQAAAAPTSTEDAPQMTSESGVPMCPKCHVPMVLRSAKRGDNAGQEFYGCVNYPKCRAIVELPQSK